MAGFNLKAIFSADSSGVKQGAKEAREAIKEFDSSATSMLDSFTGLFGTSVGQISDGMKVFKGGLLTMSQTMNGSGKAAESTSKALRVFKVALASTGVGAIVVALGSLVAYFTKSQRGADQLSRALAPVKQIFATLTDWAVALGEKIVWCFQNPKEAIKSLWEMIKNQVVNRFQGLVSGFLSLGTILEGVFTFNWDKIKQGASDFAESSKQAFTGMTKDQRQSLLNNLGGAYDELMDKAKRAHALEARKQVLIEKERAEREIISKLEARSAELRQKAEDRQAYTSKQRLAFSKQAEATVNELMTRRNAIESERLAIKVEENALSESMNKDLDGELEIKEKIAAIDKSRADGLKEIRNNQKGIVNEVEKELEIAAKIAALQAKKKEVLTLEDVSAKDAVKQAMGEAENQTIPLKIGIPEDAFQALREEYGEKMKPFMEEISIDLGAMASEGMAGFADAFGTAMGNMMTGKEGLKGFVSSIVGMIANMVSNIGKMLIKAGIGMISFKKLLTNPWTAIAAGAAMVALAAVVKTAIGNVLDGGSAGSSISSVLTSGSSTTIPSTGNSNISAAGKQSINITGKLVGSGKDLVAVINTETNRKNLTT